MKMRRKEGREGGREGGRADSRAGRGWVDGDLGLDDDESLEQGRH